MQSSNLKLDVDLYPMLTLNFCDINEVVTTIWFALKARGMATLLLL